MMTRTGLLQGVPCEASIRGKGPQQFVLVLGVSCNRVTYKGNQYQIKRHL